MNKFSIRFSKVFYSLLNQHILFASKVSKKFARKLKSNIFEELGNIEQNPLQYPLRITPLKLPFEYRRVIVNKRYLIIYFVKEDIIFVDYIFDSRMDNSKYF